MTQSSSGESDLLYRRPISVWWWTRKRTYFLFVMRELSSLFIAWMVCYLLLFIRAVSRGEAAYADFLDQASSPWLVALNLVAFGFVLLHTVTWFSLTPQAMVVSLRGRRVPAAVIIGAQYAGLAVVSAFVFWLVTR
jgi:fumarate reductase subunit C